MVNKEFDTRIINKHDTEKNWSKVQNFVPKQGEIIIYDADESHDHERFKIGDGISTVNNLPFYKQGVPIFKWATSTLPFSPSEISDTYNPVEDCFVRNPTNFEDGKLYFRYHCGSKSFVWTNPNPQVGVLTFTILAWSQWGDKSVQDRFSCIYIDYSDGSTDTLDLYNGKTVTFNSGVGKTVEKISGSWDLENWALIDLSVSSIVADYQDAPFGKIKTLNRLKPDGDGNINESDPTVPEWAKQEKKPTYTADEVGAISKNGGVMEGSLVLASSPVDDMEAVNKKYVDDLIGTILNGAS